MRTLEQTKKYECLVNGEWVPVHWEQLEAGDIVRSNEEPGGPMTEEFVLTELAYLMVNVVKGRCKADLVPYVLTGACDLDEIAALHGTTKQFIQRVNPEVTNWDDRPALAGTSIQLPRVNPPDNSTKT